MANPQLENGYTRIANELIDAIGKMDLNGVEQKVLWCLFRYTYGFQRKSHKLSASFFSEWGNCSIRAVRKALKHLKDLNVIIVTNENQKGVVSVLELNKDFESWGSGEQTCTGERLCTSEQTDTSEQTCTGEQMDTRPVNNCAPLPVNDCSPKKRNNINKKYKEKYICAFFEKAWQHYPKKKGKSAVTKKAKHELYEAGEDTVMAAIRAYSAEVEGREEKYILHGSTFFNGRWKDYVSDTKPEVRPEQQDKLDEPEDRRGLSEEEYQEFRRLGIIDDEGDFHFSVARDYGKYEILRRIGVAI